MKCKFLVAVFFVVVLFSCNKIPDHAKYIPKDAQVIGTIDMNKLTKKLIWNAITGSELFKNMQENLKSEDSKNAMKDIGNIGLKQNSTIYFYGSAQKLKEASVCVIIGMDDATKFESFLLKVYPATTTEKSEGYSSTIIENHILAAWNKEVAFFFPLHGEITDSNDMSTSMSMNDAVQIKASLKEKFSLAKENSILSNAHFKSLQNEGHDIGLWMNYEEVYLKNADASGNPFMKTEYFKDAGLATGIDFEKGKAAMVMDYYMSKDMASIYSKQPPKNINTNLLKHIPSKDVALVFGYNFNPQLIDDYAKKFGMDGLMNMAFGLAGTSMENIKKTFDGDIVFSLTDLKMKNVQSDTTATGLSMDMAPEMNMCLAVGIKNENELEKLMAVGIKNNLICKQGNACTIPGNTKSKIVYKKDMMVYSSESTLADNYLAGNVDTKNAFPPEVWKAFSSNPMVMYMNVKNVLQNIPFHAASKEEEEFATSLKGFMNYVELHGGKMKNNAVHVEGNVFLTNEKENALIQMLDIAMKGKKLSDKKAEEIPAVDSAFTQ